MKTRKIDERFKPPVSGVDLWQALNYIALDDVSLDFIYNCYTSSTIVYEPGSRPEIEKIAGRFFGGSTDLIKGIMSLAEYVAAGASANRLRPLRTGNRSRNRQRVRKKVTVFFISITI